MIIQLLAGMFLGSIVASLVWGIIVKTGKSKTEKPIRERDALMHSLGELWVEVDSLVMLFRGGKIAEKGFREKFTAKIEEINHLLKPNMHLFDVYYVKYTESLISHYSRIVRKSAGTLDITAGTPSDIEMETSFSFVDRPDAVPVPENRTRASFAGVGHSAEVLENTVIEESFPKVTLPKSASPEVTAEPKTSLDGARISFKGEITPEVSDMSFGVENKAAGTETPRQESKEDVTAVDAFESDLADELPGGGKTELFDRPLVAEQNESGPDEDVFESKAAEDVEKSEVSFDVVVESKKEPLEPKEADGIVDESALQTTAIEEEAFFESKASVAEDMAATVGSHMDRHTKETFGEEEFTMETMIDIDVNSLSSFLKPKDNEEPATEPALSDEEKKAELVNDLEIVIAANASHTDLPVTDESVTEALPKEPVFETIAAEDASALDDDGIPEETTFTRADELSKKTEDAQPEPIDQTEEDFEVMLPEPQPVTTPPSPAAEASTAAADEEVPVLEPELFESELTDVDTITGDDVAEKIGALELNAAPQTKKPASEKEVKKEPVAQPSSSAVAAKAETKKEPVKSTAVSSAKKRADDAITGDDVAEKIDAFFGLFNE